MDIGLKIGKIGETYIRGILKAYSKNRERIASYGRQPADFKEYLSYLKDKRHVLLFSVDKKDENLKHLTNHIRKSKGIDDHYTTKGLHDFIFSAFRSMLLEKKSLQLSKDDISTLRGKITSDIGTLKKRTCAFQVLYFKYSGKEFQIGNAKILKIDLNEAKPRILKIFANTVPNFHPDYAFIQIEEYGNDSTIVHQKSITKAHAILSLLKTKFYNSPLMRLHDTYMVKNEKGWSVAYSSTELFNVDSEIESIDNLDFLNSFGNILNCTSNSEFLEQIKISLIRFSRSQSYFITSLKLAEMISCLETILTTRAEGKDPEINICNLMYKRICLLVGTPENPILKKILEENYDARSDYYHQSKETALDKNASQIKGIFLEVLCRINNQWKPNLSKKEFLKAIDKSK